MKKILLLLTLLLPMALWAQQINIEPNELSGFHYIENQHGPSEEKTFVVSATGLIDTIGITDTLVITASEHFEISTQTGEGFETTLSLFANETGTVDNTTIYVRMVAELPAGSYNDTIVVSSQREYAPEVYVHCQGEVIMPTLPTPSFSPEGNTYAGIQRVTITCDIEGTTIQYRYNPSETWMDYTSPILVDRDMTIWAKATKEGYNDSEEEPADYAIEYAITVSANPEYGGTVNIDGEGTPFHYGDTATLMATPNEGYAFSSWSNGVTANPMQVTVEGDASYHAIFEAVTYQIAVIAYPENAGTVSGGGIYHYDDTVKLTATSEEGYLFSSWNNGETTNPIQFTVKGNATYQANFEAISYQITVTADPENGGIVSGGGTYHFPDMPTVIAVAHDGFVFVNWTEEGEVVSEAPEYTFIGWSSRDLVAHFKLVVLPFIEGSIATPEAICTGNTIELVAPEVLLSDHEEWQISADTTFELYLVYDGQPLDATFNGWQLRYAASNEAGVSYSNVVTITVHPTLDESEILNIIGKKCGDRVEHILVYPKSGYKYQWYRDETPIDTTQYIHSEDGLKNGTYRVEIALARGDNGQLICPVSSAEYEVNSSGSVVYPNPAHANAEIFITNESDGDALFSIYSIDGRLMHQQMVNSGENAMRICLPKGIYLSTLVNESDMVTEKIVIQ